MQGPGRMAPTLLHPLFIHESPRTIIFGSSHQATAASCQVNNIHLLRGMIGKPGCGLLHINCTN